jgi:hypothetical protein
MTNAIQFPVITPLSKLTLFCIVQSMEAYDILAY